jgi:uncharacterized membrane protein
MSSFHLGEFHPAIIHFPIALIFTALAFDIVYWFTKREIFQSIAGWLIMIVALILIPTALTGFLAKDFYPPDDPDVLRHQNMAIITAIYTIAYAIFRGYALFNNKVFSLYLYLILSLINVGLVNTTAEFGGIVVRGKGITTDSLRPTGSPLPYSHVERGE